MVCCKIPAFISMQRAVEESSRTSKAGYDPVHFARLAAIEEQHFWFTTRRKLIFNLVRSAVRSLAPGYKVLEVGCGTGNVLGALGEACVSGSVFGMDRFIEGLSFAKDRGRPGLLQGDAHAPPFATQFDIVGAFDVIEHLPDDERILRDLHGMIRPGGKLILTVPAYQWLWSEFDELAHHCRRYHQAELQSKLRAAGFTSMFVSPFMMSILPLVWLHRRKKTVPSKTNSSDIIGQEIRIVPFINALLRTILAIECFAVSRGVRLPFGTSIVAVATRS
jgi:2-polyprenyl-3-methyl-5-hydroxy-6-metoxy-1,4-benzoquinol methylase